MQPSEARHVLHALVYLMEMQSMSRLSNSIPDLLFSSAEIFVAIGIIASNRDLHLNLTCHNNDTVEWLSPSSVQATVSIPAARQLFTLLSQVTVADEEADPRQSALWLGATIPEVGSFSNGRLRSAALLWHFC